MAVDVDTRGAEPVIGVPHELMEALIDPTGQGNPYVVTADGQRFLLNTPAGDANAISMWLVVNWPAVTARK